MELFENYAFFLFFMSFLFSYFYYGRLSKNKIEYEEIIDLNERFDRIISTMDHQMIEKLGFYPG